MLWLAAAVCFNQLQIFCQRPLTCKYSHREVPSGGKASDGKGFKSISGSGGRGLSPTDGKSSVLLHISWYLQF